MYQDISFLTNDHTGDTYVIADDHCRKMASALSVNLGVETQRALNAEAAVDGRIGAPETGAYILGGNTVNQNLKELDAKVAAFSQDIGTALEEYLEDNPLPIDDELDTESENAVQNAPVATAIEALQAQLGEHTVASDVPAGAVYTDTTYTFATGDVNGQIKVTPAGSTAQHISVKGLGSAAYTNTSAYDANGTATAAVTAHNSSATAHGDIRDAMVTGVLMNGERVGTTGLIDLGTVVTDVSGKLDKAGGTMTGLLTLSGPPSENMHAATKAYVDTAAAARGDMVKATYDTDNDGVVDVAASVSNVGGEGSIEFRINAAGYGQYRAVGDSTWGMFAPLVNDVEADNVSISSNGTAETWIPIPAVGGTVEPFGICGWGIDNATANGTNCSYISVYQMRIVETTQGATSGYDVYIKARNNRNAAAKVKYTVDVMYYR